MTEENDIVGFLRNHGGEASLDEISGILNIPKYGPNSAYAILRSLRAKNIVDRKGEKWVLLTKEATIIKGAAPIMEEKEAAPATVPARSLAPTTSPTTVEQIIDAMTKTLREAMSGLREPSDEQKLATKTMETALAEKEEILSRHVLQPDVAPEAMKPLLGLPTGTFLDNLFLKSEGEALGGIPIGGQFAVTGLPGAGKSIMVEEIALRVAASGRKVLYVTAEDTWKSPTPRFDLQSRMKQKADVLGLDWNRIRENLFVADIVSYPELRDWSTLAETYRYVVEKEKIELMIIDSVKTIKAFRDALRHRVIELARYNQLHGVTGLFVNQRSAETWNTYNIDAGICIADNLDGTIILDFNFDRGEFDRIVWILNCRLCNFERRRIQINITPDGFIRLR